MDILEIRKVRAFFDDGEVCESDNYTLKNEGNSKIYNFDACGQGFIRVRIENIGRVNAVALKSQLAKKLRRIMPIEIMIGVSKNKSKIYALSLTQPITEDVMHSAFGYCNPLGCGKTPPSAVSPPPDNPGYHHELLEISYQDFVKSVPCWLSRFLVNNYEHLPPYTVCALAQHDDGYSTIFTVTNGDTTSYLFAGPKLVVHTGKEVDKFDLSYLIFAGLFDDPYEAIAKVVEATSKRCFFKLRREKKSPRILGKLGWCSWNALQTDDLSHTNVVNIVRGLRERGVPIRWIVIDDGWQQEVSSQEIPPSELFRRIITSAEPSKEKFPHGFKKLADDLKNLGIDDMGLWFTINLHWGGTNENVIKELCVGEFRSPVTNTCIPPPSTDGSLKFYYSFLRRAQDVGFTFAKVDNQWSIHPLYTNATTVGEAARAVELGLQLALESLEMEVINCMSMTPENYSHFLLSNIVRNSIDYLPFWKAGAKLHLFLNTYNALLVEKIAYPDYDMFITYDPASKAHVVARVFSGGPIYITDRYPKKTDIDLIKMITLPTGEAIIVDEPGLPTRDVLFADPYTEPKLFKIASKCRRMPVVAIFNVHKDGITIGDTVSLSDMPFSVEDREYAYYLVFSRKYGFVKPRDAIELELGELETEVIVFSPVVNDVAIIGVDGYVLPPYAMQPVADGYMKPLVDGDLIVIDKKSGPKKVSVTRSTKVWMGKQNTVDWSDD